MSTRERVGQSWHEVRDSRTEMPGLPARPGPGNAVDPARAFRSARAGRLCRVRGGWGVRVRGYRQGRRDAARVQRALLVAPELRRRESVGAGLRVTRARRRQAQAQLVPRQDRDPQLLDQDLPALSRRDAVRRSARRSLREHPDIVLLTISTDETLEDTRDTMRSVLGGDPPFHILLDPDAEIVTDKYGTKLFPETWFVDPKGVIRARFDGARDWASALPIDLAKSLLGPVQCDVGFQFESRAPTRSRYAPMPGKPTEANRVSVRGRDARGTRAGGGTRTSGYRIAEALHGVRHWVLPGQGMPRRVRGRVARARGRSGAGITPRPPYHPVALSALAGLDPDWEGL